MSGPTDPAEAHFDKGSWGWDGSEWRKLPLIWGYSDRWAEQALNENAAAGTNDLTLTAVPAGEIWVLDALGAMNLISAVTIQLAVWGGGIGVGITAQTAMGAAAWLWKFPIGVVLKEGDYAGATFWGCTAGDDLYVRAWGYKMAIAE